MKTYRTIFGWRTTGGCCSNCTFKNPLLGKIVTEHVVSSWLDQALRSRNEQVENLLALSVTYFFLFVFIFLGREFQVKAVWYLQEVVRVALFYELRSPLRNSHIMCYYALCRICRMALEVLVDEQFCLLCVKSITNENPSSFHEMGRHTPYRKFDETAVFN